MLLALIAAAALSQDPNPQAQLDALSGYQRATWGMSSKEVRKLFPKAKLSSDGFLTLEGPVAGFPATTAFLFAQDKLKAVAIAFDESSGRLPMDVYKALAKAMIEKYGTPEITPGLAEEVSARWSGEKTRLLLNHHAVAVRHVTLSYSSVALAELQDLVTKEQAKDL